MQHIHIAMNNKLKHSLFVFTGVLAFGGMLSLYSDNVEAMRAQTSGPQDRYTMSVLLPPSEQTELTSANELPSERAGWQTIKVRRGDTMSQMFERAGLGPQDVYEVISLGKPVKTLKKIVPGQEIELKIDQNGQMESLIYKINDRNSLFISRNQEDELVSKIESRDYDTHVAFAKGAIDSSLFEAGEVAGLPQQVIMDMAHIFGWDIDFALDIRQGDNFLVMYEEHYLDGKKISNGNILAAEFTNQDKTYSAIRYTDDKGRSGYFSPDGKNMRKTFLRTPVDFTRISSRFGNRKHPTLKRWKKHTGVDYAAPRGTPIKASGDGKIVYRGKKGGYGKTVIIEHGNGYRTLYAHMNNYNRKAKWGKYVKQGQVIGYVGSTGRATGPHLHYEFRVGGRHRNPLTVRLPDASPLAKKYQEDFAKHTNVLLAQFSYLKDSKIALSSL